MKNNICLITNGYPTKEDPIYAFIQPLVHGLADMGATCTIIAPQSKVRCLINNKKRRPYRWIDKTRNGNDIVVYQPEYISFSNLNIFGTNISNKLRDDCIKRCYIKECLNADVLYAHFWDCGLAASKIASIQDIPVFVATGESEIRIRNYYSKDTISKYLPYIKGVISVSTKNLQESYGLGLLKYKPKTIILPNAVNTEEFYPIPQEKARRSLGFNLKDKIVAFVGTFCHRKGVIRVVKAIERLENVKLILIGSGEQNPESNRIIFCGKVSHDEIVKYLNAADIFALPTLAEGCCNSVVEALACGLPIVSSNLPFNDDILDETNSIRVNPNSIDELSFAIKKLLDDHQLKSSLSQGAYHKAKSLTINNRAKEIYKFILNS